MTFFRRFKCFDRVISKYHGVCDVVEVLNIFEGYPYRIRKQTTGEYFWSEEKDLMPIGDKIVIMREGGDVVARLYAKKERIATARCEFHNSKKDFVDAARIAIKRLINDDEKEDFYNGRIFCVAGDHSREYDDHNGRFRYGKIYTVRDGHVYGENGFVSKVQYRTVRDMNIGLLCEFIALTED